MRFWVVVWFDGDIKGAEKIHQMYNASQTVHGPWPTAGPPNYFTIVHPIMYFTMVHPIMYFTMVHPTIST